MRLTPLELQGILKALDNALLGVVFELYLYGSRVDDKQKGGDIDLLLLVPDSEINRLETRKHVLLASIKAEIGEIRIDLSITSRQAAAKDPFFSIILPNAIRLRH